MDKPSKYTITKSLGQGAYANVSLAYKKQKKYNTADSKNKIKLYAVKSISKFSIDSQFCTVD